MADRYAQARVGPERRSDSIADVTGTADGTYSANEQTLINDLKTALNSALEAMRKAGILKV